MSITVQQVAPFSSAAEEREAQYFADGMTEALITDLAKIGALKVISRSSTMRYKGTDKPLAEIAKELDVDVLVEGSALRVGGSVRIVAQLIDPETEQAAWAESYEQDLENVLLLWNEQLAHQREWFTSAPELLAASERGGLAKAGYEGAQRQIAGLLAARFEESNKGPVSRVAQYYLYAGDYDRASNWLEKAFEAHDPGLPYRTADPIHDPLRSDPRFQDLLRRMNLPTNRYN